MKKLISRRDFLRVQSAMTPPAQPRGLCTAGAQWPIPGGRTYTAEAPAAAPPAGLNAVQLRLSVWADVQDADVYTKLTAAFAEANPEIAVAIEQYFGYCKD